MLRELLIIIVLRKVTLKLRLKNTKERHRQLDLELDTLQMEQPNIQSHSLSKKTMRRLELAVKLLKIK